MESAESIEGTNSNCADKPLLDGLPRKIPVHCREMSPSWTTRKLLVFFLLAFVYFLNWNCFGLLLSFFPHEAAKYGMSSTTVGLIFGIYNLVGFVTSFFYGMSVIPRIGPYFVLNAGLFVNGGANIAFGFLNLIEDPKLFAIYCFIVRAVAALGGTACETAIFVIVTREFRDSIATISGLLEFFTGLGSALGPVIGGGLYSLGGFRLPLVLTGGLLMLTMPLIWCFLPRKVYPAASGGGAAIKKAITNPGVLMLSISSFIHVTAVNCIDPILEPYAEKFGVNTIGVGLLFLYSSLTYMVSTPLTGWILQKKSWRRSLLVFSSFLTFMSLLFMGPAPFLTPFIPTRTVWLLAVSMAFCGIGDAVFFVPVLPELQRCCQERGLPKGPTTDSVTSGLYTAFYNLGSFVGPVVGGLMHDYLGFQWTTTIMAFTVAGQTVFLVIFFCISRRPPLANHATEIEPPILNNSINAGHSYGSIST